MELFFTSGIFMVIGAAVLITQNTDLLLKGLSAFGSLFPKKLPAARTAVAYPGAAISRTGMTIAMFSLIIFSLVMMATMNQTWSEMALGDESNGGWHVVTELRGANQIDVKDELAARGVSTEDFAAFGATTNPSEADSSLRLPDAAADGWKDYLVWGMDEAFIEHTSFAFEQRATGYATDDAIIEALRTTPNLAVVDAQALEQDGFGGGDDAFVINGLTADDTVFEPRAVELLDRRTGEAHSVTVIGVIDQKIGSLSGLYTNQATVDAIYGNTASTSWFFALNDDEQAEVVAEEIEAALLTYGAQGYSIRDQLREAQKEQTGFLYIIEGFMGLGLFVGVAAIGVIAFRSVVERRQQIGVLRALGWRKELVSLSFMIETAFVVGIGILTGTLLGLQLSSKLVSSGELGSDNVPFVIPWPTLLVMIGATFIVSLLMTWVPSRQAARIAPAEALRYE
jgi:putative ABC transport system permease protein